MPKFEHRQSAEGECGREEKKSMAEKLALLGAEEKREMLTVALAARLLGKSRDTIYRWLAEGRVAGRKVGGRWLVYRDSVEAKWEKGLVEPERD